jgi:branched-chain amino acid transport system substrate-binding protein
MYRFKESATEFYTNYQTARKVIRPSYRSRGEAEAEAEEESAAEGKGAKTAGEVFAPLDNKDYSPYFGQIRSAKPTVLYTSVAGNDTVRLFTQMAEFGVNRNIQVVGASGTVTGQNLAAIGKAADGFVTGVGYSTSIPTAENQKFVAEFTAANKAAPDLYGADSYGVLFAYKAAVEKAKSTDTDAVRTALRGLQWATPQGVKTLRASDHQAMQDMYAVRVNSGKFEIVGKVAAAAAIGADTCTKF